MPRHRVINARGEISPDGHVDRPMVQRQMLEGEGVRFDDQGRVDLRQFLWRPDVAVVLGGEPEP